MNQERNDLLNKYLTEYIQGIESTGKTAPLSAEYRDPVLNEFIGYDMPGMKDNTEAVKQLEDMGYKVIFPAELSEYALKSMSDTYLYEEKLNNALIIDTKSQKPSLEFAKMIIEHFLSTGRTKLPFGFDRTNNTLTNAIGMSGHKEGTAEKLQELLMSVGFNPTLEGEGYEKKLTVSSDIPYPAVRRSMFKKIYDGAKGKIQRMWAKLKSIGKAKDQVAENEKDEIK